MLNLERIEMKTSRVLCINGSTQFLIPADMSAKELQAICGLLVSLHSIHSEWTYTDSDYGFYAGDGVEVRIRDVVLSTKQEVMDKVETGRKAYQAQKEKEKSSS